MGLYIILTKGNKSVGKSQDKEKGAWAPRVVNCGEVNIKGNDQKIRVIFFF